MAYDALKNPAVQKALKQAASTGVQKAGELLAAAQTWLKKRGTDANSSAESGEPGTSAPRKPRRRAKAGNRTGQGKTPKGGRKKRIRSRASK